MTNSRRALLVDDERLARVRMRKLLGEHCEVEIIGEAKNVSDAAKIVKTEEPDLIFLDVQMPGGSGLELFERCNVDADVVLVTAHDQHALRAFEAGAVDYLMKPVSPQRLAITMERLKRIGRVKQPPDPSELDDRISVIAREDGLEVVSVKDITHIHGADDYSEIFLKGGESRLSLRRLSEWDERLGSNTFFRIHRSTIVNTQYILGIERSGKSHFAVVQGASERLAIARRRVRDLKVYLDKK